MVSLSSFFTCYQTVMYAALELLEWEQLSFIVLLLGPFVCFITFILAATHEIDGDI